MRHCLFLILIAVLLIPVAAMGQSAAEKIANAMTAAPPSISDAATVLDWPATEDGPMTTLREGTNGWTCLPDMPATEGNDPMCLDAPWMAFFEAYMAHEELHIDRVGFGYMIAPGGAHGSNTDPYATGPTDDNEWGYDPPHLMILVPDARALDGLPTTRGSGPWVMYSGTPYAHIMAPIAPYKEKE